MLEAYGKQPESPRTVPAVLINDEQVEQMQERMSDVSSEDGFIKVYGAGEEGKT